VRRLHWRTAASALATLVLFGCTDWFGESIVGCEPNPRELCRQQNPSPTDRSDAHLGCDEISNGTNWAERLTIYRVDTEALNEVVDPFRGDDSATVEMRRDRARWTLTHPELAPLREAVEPKLENREGKRAVYWYVFENTKAPEDEGPSSGVMGNDESEDNEPFRIELAPVCGGPHPHVERIRPTPVHPVGPRRRRRAEVVVRETLVGAPREGG